MTLNDLSGNHHQNQVSCASSVDFISLWSLSWLVYSIAMLLVLCQLSHDVIGCKDRKMWLLHFDPSFVSCGTRHLSLLWQNECTTNSTSQYYTHPYDHTSLTYDSWVETIYSLNNIVCMVFSFQNSTLKNKITVHCLPRCLSEFLRVWLHTGTCLTLPQTNNLLWYIINNAIMYNVTL